MGSGIRARCPLTCKESGPPTLRWRLIKEFADPASEFGSTGRELLGLQVRVPYRGSCSRNADEDRGVLKACGIVVARGVAEERTDKWISVSQVPEAAHRRDRDLVTCPLDYLLRRFVCEEPPH